MAHLDKCMKTYKVLQLHPEWFCTLSLRSVTETEGNIWCLWDVPVGFIFKNPSTP